MGSSCLEWSPSDRLFAAADNEFVLTLALLMGGVICRVGGVIWWVGGVSDLGVDWPDAVSGEALRDLIAAVIDDIEVANSIVSISFRFSCCGCWSTASRFQSRAFTSYKGYKPITQYKDYNKFMSRADCGRVGYKHEITHSMTVLNMTANGQLIYKKLC